MSRLLTIKTSHRNTLFNKVVIHSAISAGLRLVRVPNMRILPGEVNDRWNMPDQAHSGRTNAILDKLEYLVSLKTQNTAIMAKATNNHGVTQFRWRLVNFYENQRVLAIPQKDRRPPQSQWMRTPGQLPWQIDDRRKQPMCNLRTSSGCL